MPVLSPVPRVLFLPSIHAVMPADEGAEMGAANGIYRPPRLNPTTMEDDEDPDKDTGKRNRRAQREGARRAARSDVVRSLAAEVAGAPEEVGCPFIIIPWTDSG